MYKSLVNTVILIILCFSYIRSDALRQLCNTFKPNGVFEGIKVYNKYIETDFKNNSQKVFKHFVYKNGKEWQFILQFNQTDENLSFVVDSFRNMRADGLPVVHRYRYNMEEFDVSNLNLYKNEIHSFPRLLRKTTK